MGERKQKLILRTLESLAGNEGTGMKRSQSENRLIESVDLVDGKGAAAEKS